ncbi:MAG: protein kinase [Aristaeellaceae bacterium]
MSEHERDLPRTVQALAAYLQVSESEIKHWLRTSRMRIGSHGQLSEEQYRAVLAHWAPQDSAPPASPAGADSRTVLNQAAAASENATTLNSLVHGAQQTQDPDATVLNAAVHWPEHYHPGDWIATQYRVISSLDSVSGEADLYLCESQGVNYIAKVYRRDKPVKDDVWKALQAVQSPYVVHAVERHWTDGQTVEILPYYRRGSLASARLNEQQLIRVIRCVNEGLRALHDAKVIHKDIKPSNLVWADNGEDVLIIDFGISSHLDGDRTLKFTSTGLTLQYAAPETLHNIFSRYSDYYALGVTVYELLEGHTPYSDMTPEQLGKYYSIQNFPVPENVSPRLRDLILGTTYFDIRNREDTDNPNCRWSYEQVRQWCDGACPAVPGQGQGAGFGTIAAYAFQGKSIQTREELARQLCVNWEEGKDELFSGRLVRHFSQRDSVSGSELQQLMSEGGDADIVLMRALHVVDHGTFAFMWKGRYFQHIKDFAYQAQEALVARDRQLRSCLETAMAQHAISVHAGIVYPQRRELSDQIRKIENYFINLAAQRREQEVCCHVMLYQLQGKYVLKLGDRAFESIAALTSHIMQLRDTDTIAFEQCCHSLIAYDNGLSPQFEAWLIALGKKNTVHQWRNSIIKAKE